MAFSTLTVSRRLSSQTMDCARQRKPSRAAPTPEQVDAEVKQIDPRALKEFAEAAARYAKKNPWKPVHAANARGRLSRLLGSLARPFARTPHALADCAQQRQHQSAEKKYVRALH